MNAICTMCNSSERHRLLRRYLYTAEPRFWESHAKALFIEKNTKEDLRPYLLQLSTERAGPSVSTRLLDCKIFSGKDKFKYIIHSHVISSVVGLGAFMKELSACLDNDGLTFFSANVSFGKDINNRASDSGVSGWTIDANAESPVAYDSLKKYAQDAGLIFARYHLSDVVRKSICAVGVDVFRLAKG